MRSTPKNLDYIVRLIDKRNRIVGFRVLQKLLQPTHEFFKARVGYLTELEKYQGQGCSNYLLYPRVSAVKENPYVLHQRRRSHTGRIAQKLFRLFDGRDGEKMDLERPVLYKLFLTMPEQLSEWIVSREDGVKIAWRLFHRFWKDYLRINGECDGKGSGALVNLHIWETTNPLKPHVHFHCLILSHCFFRKGEDGWDVKQRWVTPWADCLIPSYRLHKKGGKPCWAVNRKRKDGIPDGVTKLIKEKWKARLLALAEHWNIEDKAIFPRGKVNVKALYVPFSERPRVMGAINYNQRHWIEDYVKYTMERPDCPRPPGWLYRYVNRGRAFGCWKFLSRIAPDEGKGGGISKVSPVTGETMVYCGTVSVEELLAESKGRIGFIDFERGRLKVGNLTKSDIEWLRSATRSPPEI